MDKNLIGLLSKGSKLVNLYTGDVYRFIEQDGDSQFVKAVLKGEEKWNKYKLVYENVPEKEMRVDATELIPGDKIPFVSIKGKKLFDVRNMEIVTYKRNKDTIKARVVYLGGGNEDKDTVFTFVGQDGNDISDTGKGYTAEQFANDYNKKKRAVKKIDTEDGLFSEIDTRFNVVEKVQKTKKEKPKAVSLKKAYKPLSISGMRKRIKKLGFYYKDHIAYQKLSLWAIKVKKQTEIAVTEDYIKELLANKEDKSLERFKFLEAYNLAKQLKTHEDKHSYQIELANIKRKASIDVTEEEKAYTNSNIQRIEKAISDCDAALDELNGFRKTILEDHNKEVAEIKAEKKSAKKAKKAMKASTKKKKRKGEDAAVINTAEEVA